MNIKTLGIDIAKNVFQLHGIDSAGKIVVQKRLARKKLVPFIENLPRCIIGIEACGGSNHWARKFRKMGFDMKLMGAQFVKPYVKSNKNDMKDAEAICEAVTRPNMRFVGIKEIAQQDIQCLLRIRSRLVKERTAIVNQVRGLLAEYGIVVAQGVSKLRKELPNILEDAENELSTLSRETFFDLSEQIKEVAQKIKSYDLKIQQMCITNDTCQELTKLEGVGPLTATAIVSSIGDPNVFKNGREMAAFIGLVPRQYSSGGKNRLLGISKRGDKYLRCLLIHGARAVIHRAKKIPTKKSDWIKSLVERRGVNRAAVALANKNARIMWAILSKKEKYQPNHT